jgi:hypothetical protein
MQHESLLVPGREGGHLVRKRIVLLLEKFSQIACLYIP